MEKKRQILKYVTFVQNQMLKLSVLVKWAENADDIQMCQVTRSWRASYAIGHSHLDLLEYHGFSGKPKPVLLRCNSFLEQDPRRITTSTDT